MSVGFHILISYNLFEMSSMNCDLCTKTFVSAHILRRHIKDIHEKTESVRCDPCGKVFTRKDSLTKHTRVVHNGEKPHVCDICGKTFSQKGNMRSHREVHNEIPPTIYQWEMPSKSEIGKNEEKEEEVQYFPLIIESTEASDDPKEESSGDNLNMVDLFDDDDKKADVTVQEKTNMDKNEYNYSKADNDISSSVAILIVDPSDKDKKKYAKEKLFISDDYHWENPTSIKRDPEIFMDIWKKVSDDKDAKNPINNIKKEDFYFDERDVSLVTSGGNDIEFDEEIKEKIENDESVKLKLNKIF